MKSIFVEPYDNYLEKLSALQLQFEYFRYQVISNPSIFGQAPNLEESLKSLDNYLGNIIFEYQERRRKFDSNSRTQDISFLPMLANFILDYDEGFNFKPEFKDPFYIVVNGLRDILLS